MHRRKPPAPGADYSVAVLLNSGEYQIKIKPRGSDVVADKNIGTEAWEPGHPPRAVFSVSISAWSGSIPKSRFTITPDYALIVSGFKTREEASASLQQLSELCDVKADNALARKILASSRPVKEKSADKGARR